MRIWHGDDRGDPMIIVTQGDPPIDDRPLAKVIRLRGKHHEARLRICTAIISDLSALKDTLGQQVLALAETGFWRQLAGDDLPPEPMKPRVKSFWETRDPSIRHALRLLHQVGTTLRAFETIADHECRE